MIPTPASPEEVISIVEGIRYRWPLIYRNHIGSAVNTLKRGKGICLDGALAAAYLMEPLGFEPRLLDFGPVIVTDGISLSHVVYYFEDPDGFSSIGLSKYEPLRSIRERKDNLGDLAREYGRRSVEVGLLEPKWFKTIDLNKISDINWRDGRFNILRVLQRLDEVAEEIKL